jgi:hypothetical protein
MDCTRGVCIFPDEMKSIEGLTRNVFVADPMPPVPWPGLTPF